MTDEQKSFSLQLPMLELEDIFAKWLHLCGLSDSTEREEVELRSMKGAMWEALLLGTEALLSDWKMPSPEEIWERTSPNPERLLASMKEVETALHGAGARHGMNYYDGRYIESWPSRMRESGYFNCVGASVVGCYYLQSFLNWSSGFAFSGVLPNHSVLLAKPQEGRWLLLDLMNRECRELLGAEETISGGLPFLELPEGGDIEGQRRILVMPLRDLCGSVIGNAGAVPHSMAATWIAERDRKVIEAFYEANQFLYEGQSLAAIGEILFLDLIHGLSVLK